MLRQQAKYQGYGGGGITAPTGLYQEMAGRITRRTGGARKKFPQGQQRDRILTRRWMDAMGIDCVCLFPTPMLGLPFTPTPEVEVAMARAYNRWLVEQCAGARSRGIKSSLYLPMSDPEAAYKMVQDFGGKPGVIGFTIIASTLRPVTDNLYRQDLALMQERGRR